MKTYLLDTNIISDVLRKKRLEVSKRLESAIADNAVIILSPVVYFEIMRGLLHANAERQMLFFMALMMEFRWTDLERADWDRATSALSIVI
jgi:predicted nucleic acid-binding protein